MDVDAGYAHLFVDDPSSTFTDNQGHELIGRYDASVDVVSASLTFRWGGPRETTRSYSKDSGYRK
jgi:long-subunit fatty acid transport protein